MIVSTPKRQKTQESDLIDSLTIIEDSNTKENKQEYINQVNSRNKELQQLRSKTKNFRTLEATQTNNSQEFIFKRPSIVDLNTNLPFSQTYLSNNLNKKRRDPFSLKINEIQQIRRYESLENLLSQPSSRNNGTTRNNTALYFNAQQIQVSQLIKSIGRRY